MFVSPRIPADVVLLRGRFASSQVLVAVTLFSLLLTALDWSVAYTGVVIDAIILALVWPGPRIVSWLSR